MVSEEEEERDMKKMKWRNPSGEHIKVSMFDFNIKQK